ncbi:MAG TPA: hypothetical protein VD794_10995 [Flavisolibacter sp.]|nr:hypothetical protein [Flavisolibacter sp.]
MKQLLIIVTLSVIVGCKSDPKYTVRIVFEPKKSLKGKTDYSNKERVFTTEQPSDSLAYRDGLLAFLSECQGIEAMRQKGTRYSVVPKSFTVYNEKGEDIRKYISQTYIERLDRFFMKEVNTPLSE